MRTVNRNSMLGVSAAALLTAALAAPAAAQVRIDADDIGGVVTGLLAGTASLFLKVAFHTRGVSIGASGAISVLVGLMLGVRLVEVVCIVAQRSVGCSLFGFGGEPVDGYGALRRIEETPSTWRRTRLLFFC